MKDKGFALISLLIAVAIIAIVFSSSSFYSGSTSKTIEESGGINDILDKANNAAEQVNDNNKKIEDALNGKTSLKECPDEWIVNKMPGFDSNDSNKQYFILEGKRRELSEFDMSWVSVNCKIEKQVVF